MNHPKKRESWSPPLRSTALSKARIAAHLGNRAPSFATPYPTLEYLSVTSLHPYERNARTHSKKQIRQIAKSIERFGFINPVLISDDAGSSLATAASRPQSFSRSSGSPSCVCHI